MQATNPEFDHLSKETIFIKDEYEVTIEKVGNTSGYDGHCLRAFTYFREDMPEVPDTVAGINGTKDTYPVQRQDSKPATFALTYQGTHNTLMVNLGWDYEKAMAVTTQYHKLYAVSDKYVQDRLEEASRKGYVTVAFGLRVRTPLLQKILWGAKKYMPYEAAAEGRTAGNALGQSYGLLNNRAAIEFWRRVWASEFKYDILPCSLIHDAIYLLIKNDIRVIEWANNNLIECMEWQELPEIQHDIVKIGAALDVFWPDWAHPTTLPIRATQDQLLQASAKARKKLEDEKAKKK